MKNRMDDLRDHLFETLEGLKDGDMEIDRAKAICEVGGKLIDTAKVEVQYLEVTGQTRGSRFLESKKPELTAIDGHGRKVGDG